MELNFMNKDDLKKINEKYITFLENDPSVIIGDMSIRDTVNQYGLGAFTQYLEIIEIRPLENYKLWCKLKTGETKIYDFTPHLEQPIFQYLKDQSKFDTVSIGHSGVPTWIDESGDDVDIGISWILIYGINVDEKENKNGTTNKLRSGAGGM